MQILRRHQDPCTVHVSESSTSFHRLFCVGCRYSRRLLSQQEHISVGRVAGPWGVDTPEGGVLNTRESLGSLIVLQVLVGHLQEDLVLLLVRFTNHNNSEGSLQVIPLVLLGQICHLHCVMELHKCSYKATNVML